jgi:hypothetical protein
MWIAGALAVVGFLTVLAFRYGPVRSSWFRLAGWLLMVPSATAFFVLRETNQTERLLLAIAIGTGIGVAGFLIDVRTAPTKS